MFKVEKSPKKLQLRLPTKYSLGGDIDYGNLTDVVINVVGFNKALVGEFSTANGVYRSGGLINNKLSFSNSSKTWFIYWSVIRTKWVLVNQNPT